MATWIVCAGMIRSGSTVQYQLTADLVTSHLGGTALGYVSTPDFPALYHSHADRPDTYVIKMHAYAPEVAELAAQKKARVLYIYRDIRDVTVSLMNKLDLSFWEVLLYAYIRRALRHSWEWTRIDDVLVSQYESTVHDLPLETGRIGRYLGIHLSDAEAKSIAEKYSLDRQRSRIRTSQSSDSSTQPESTRPESRSRRISSELHGNHIHSGAAEQWKSALTPFQIAVLEQAAHDWLLENDYPISQPRTYRKLAAPAYGALSIGTYLRSGLQILRHPWRDGWKVKRFVASFSDRA